MIRSHCLTLALVVMVLSILTCAVSAATLDAATSAQLTAALAKATPGTIVQLAPGCYACAPAIPAGVTLRGAGYGKTILDAAAAEVGVTLAGDKAALTGLTVFTRGGTAVLAQGVKEIDLSGVLVRGGAVGIRLRDIAGVRLENCIVDGSLTGVACDGVTGAGIVNNTFTHTDTVGISLARMRASAVFNNIVTDAGVAICVNTLGADVQVDHNLYVALYAGKYNNEAARISLGPWRDVSGGLDAMSVCLPVRFRNAAQGDYQPVSTLDWNSGYSTTAYWGVPQLGSVKAPAYDVAGDARPARPGLGARESVTLPAVTPDGTFTVAQDDGTKSAGVFTRNGAAVRYLFHDLPLPKGRYGFVLPSRSELGAAIAAGDYELRIVESNLRISYRMLTGNNGMGPGVDSDRDGLSRAGFAPDGSLVFGGGWSERNENLRAKNLATGKAVWSLPGGALTLGLCRGADGLEYALLQSSPNAVLIRLNTEGHLKMWPSVELMMRRIELREQEASLGLRLPVNIANASGLAELGGTLYLTGRDGQVYRLPIATGKLEPAFTADHPCQPFADRQRGLLWMLCGTPGTADCAVTAFTSTGEVKYTLKLVAHPLGIAVNGDRLAIADYDTGKVRFFDIHDPAAPVEKQALGRGDGPYGPILADRFWFQKGPYNPPHEVIMDLDDAGRLALLDGGSRPEAFAANGASLYMGVAQFGNAPYWARFPGEEYTSRFFDSQARISWTVDAAKGTWAPEAYWGRPELNLPGGNATIGFFKSAGKVYGVMNYTMPEGNPKRSGYLFLRYDNYVGKIVAFYCDNGAGLVVRRDVNGDGAITAVDGDGTPVLDIAGNRLHQGEVMARFARFEPNGNIRSEESRYWIFKGVDANGFPIYEFPAPPACAFDAKALVSPYTFHTNNPPRPYSLSDIAADGDLLAGMGNADSPHGTGLSNSGCVDVARFRKDGALRWYLPLNDYGPIQGVDQVTPGVILSCWGHQAEWIGLDDDGLSLGHLGFPANGHWAGYWLDHPDHWCLFLGNDHRLHIMAGDYFNSGCHWLTLSNYDSYRKKAYPFTVSDARAAALAALPPVTTFLQATSEKPHFVVKKLPAPLPIDGDLEKWHKLGLAPQIIITPATGSAGIKSARECSAVIRVAYQGKDLYVQVLRFCEVPTFHQTIATGTQNQDTVEMMINGFIDNGFQFSIGKFSTDGEQIVRRRFFAGNLQRNLAADFAPRIIKVLDDAGNVPERKLVESATGEDLSTCKVIVTEFKMPIDARTYAGSEQSLFPVESGQGFYLGFMIDDNDVPGTDQQKLEVWPACFNTFSGKENSSYVTFE